MFVAGKLFQKAGEGSGGDSHNKGYFADLEALEEAYPTGEAGDYAIVGSTDTVWLWDEDTSAWVDSDTKGQVVSVNSKTGTVVLTAEDVDAVPQYTTMPVASATNADDIVQFVGATAGSYTNGYFYKNVTSSTTVPASAVEIDSYTVDPDVTISSNVFDVSGFANAFCLQDGVPVESQVKFVYSPEGYSDEVCYENLTTGASGSAEVLPGGGTYQNYMTIEWEGDPSISNSGDYVTIQYTPETQTLSYSWTRVDVQPDPLPSQTGYSGRVLGTDGFVAGWVEPEIVQRSTMPQAGADELGNIYQFIGTTDANYTNGYFYKCVSKTTYNGTITDVLGRITFDNTNYSLGDFFGGLGIANYQNIEMFMLSCMGDPTDPDADWAFVVVDGNGSLLGMPLLKKAEMDAAGFTIDTGSYPPPFQGMISLTGTTTNVWEVIETGNQVLQCADMPFPMPDIVGKVVQYVGTTGKYTNGYFYKCVVVPSEDPDILDTYAWTAVQVQAGGGATYTAGVGISIDANNEISTQNIPADALANTATPEADVDIPYALIAMCDSGTQEVGLSYQPAVRSVNGQVMDVMITAENLYAVEQMNVASVNPFVQQGKIVQNKVSATGYTAGYFYKSVVTSTPQTASITVTSSVGAQNITVANQSTLNAWCESFAGENGFTGSVEYIDGSWQMPIYGEDFGADLSTLGITYTGTPQEGDSFELSWDEKEYAWQQTDVQPSGGGVSSISVTLPAASWSGGSQTVTATGVTASNTVIIGAAPTSQAEYTTCGVICTAQGADSLTFTATSTPTNDLSVTVLILA